MRKIFTDPIPTFAAFILGALFGSGSVWSFFESNRRDTEIQIDQLRLSSEIREKLSKMANESLELQKKRLELLTTAEVSQAERESPERRADELLRRLEVLALDATAIEMQLANIERREPRNLAVMSAYPRPEPPALISVTVK